RWTRQPRPLPGAIDHRHVQLAVERHVPAGADLAEKCERVRVTAEEHVLTVVDDLTRVAIGEGGRAPPEPRTRLEHDHARAAARQRNRCAQPCEPAADDGDVVVGQSGHSHCFTAMSAWRARGTRAGAVNTSYPFRSIRRSVSK